MLAAVHSRPRAAEATGVVLCILKISFTISVEFIAEQRTLPSADRALTILPKIILPLLLFCYKSKLLAVLFRGQQGWILVAG